MIPMPPTTSEIEAIPPSSRVSVPLIDEAASSSWVWSKTLKSSSSVAASSWRSRSRAVISALVASMSAPSATLTPMVRTLSPPTKYFCTVATGTMTWSSGSWNPLPPLGWRMPTTVNGMPPIEISVPEVVGVRGPGPPPSTAPRTATRSPRSDCDVGQERALPDARRRGRRVGRGRPDDRRVGRLVAGRDGQRSWTPPARRRRPRRAPRWPRRPRATGSCVPSLDCVVGLIVSRFVPELAEPVGDVRGRALADADQGDDRGDADDDPEHRQGGAEPAGAQAREGEAQQLAEAHAAIRPSRRWIWRLALAATSASWVMSTIVRPLAWSSRKTSSTSAPERLSRLPVGSSARMSAGSVTSARATATRCCWPPLSSVGSCVTRSPRPSRSSAARARSRPLATTDALVEQRGRDVVERGRARQQVVRLEDEADGPAAEPGEPVVVEVGDRGAGQLVGAGGRSVEAAQDVHHRALARAGRADDRDELAGLDVEASRRRGRAPRRGPSGRSG